MVIRTDQKGQKAIEALCHSAMVNTPANQFINNLAWITKLLSCIEIETSEPPPAELSTDESPTPGP